MRLAIHNPVHGWGNVFIPVWNRDGEKIFNDEDGFYYENDLCNYSTPSVAGS